MAKYKAAVRIKHGKADGSSVVFEPGETVTGLSGEEMKSLWDAGSLEADDGTTSDAMQPDLSAEVRASVTPEDKQDMTVEEVAAHAPDGGKDTQKGTTDSAEKPAGGTEDVKSTKSTSDTTKPTTTTKNTSTTGTTKSGTAAPEK